MPRVKPLPTRKPSSTSTAYNIKLRIGQIALRPLLAVNQTAKISGL
jgi:hypothetical protein